MVKLGTDVLTVFLSPNLRRKEDILVKSLKGKELGKGISRTMYFINPSLLIDLAIGRLFMVKQTMKYSKNYVLSSMKMKNKSMSSKRILRYYA
jgi:hypothetical protein